MTNLENLINEIEKNCINLEEEYKKYEEIITELCSEFPNSLKWLIGLRYLSGSYNGRKICFHRNIEHENLKSMIMTLITTNNMEKFLEYLTVVAIPLHKNDEYVQDFHF